MFHGVLQFAVSHFQFFDESQPASCLSVRSSESLHVAFIWLPFPIGQMCSQAWSHHTWRRISASLNYEGFHGY